MYQILLNWLMDMDAYIYVKQKKSMQDGQAVFFDIRKQFLDTYHVTRQATDTERKLHCSHYDGDKKGWDCDKYVALHKEQHAIIESLTGYGYIWIDNGTDVCHFLQGIKSTELETTANVVQVQPEKCDADFDVTVSYLGLMIMKKGSTMQSVYIAKTMSKPVKPKVVDFI